jgi:hypothetical protein
VLCWQEPTQDSTPRNVNHIDAYICLFCVLHLLAYNLLLYVQYEIDVNLLFSYKYTELLILQDKQ